MQLIDMLIAIKKYNMKMTEFMTWVHSYLY